MRFGAGMTTLATIAACHSLSPRASRQQPRETASQAFMESCFPPGAAGGGFLDKVLILRECKPEWG